LIIAIILLMIISSAPDCAFVCNKPLTEKEKPIEEIQAHPFTGRLYK